MEGASLRKCGRGLLALTLVGLGALASAPCADGAVITFDPDGAEAANGAQPIGGLDWAVGNMLGDGMAVPVGGNTFQQHYQATLAGVINTAGLTVAPAGLNNPDGFEITAVMSVTERISVTFSTDSSTQTVIHQMAPVQSANSFFEIWFDTTPDADNLAGTGFNDGVRILLAAPNPNRPSIGNYTTAPDAGGDAEAVELFDQFVIDDYAGKQSLVGAGGFLNDNSVAPGNQDPFFFITQVQSMGFNTSVVTPFEEVDPSHLFVGTAGGVPPAIIPLLGIINGQGTAPGTNDIQFQADGNVTFTPVPEPGAAVIAAGFAVGMLARRRRA